MILFLSNGHGEDLIGATLAAKVRELRPSTEVKALAVVGEGKPYAAAGIPLVGPRRTMPSGGFTRNSLQNLLGDLRAGLLPLLLGQVAALRRLRPETRLVVAVGDILVNYLALRQSKRPTVFLPTAKSDYIAPHFGVEVALMRECLKVFPRDALTAARLKDRGVKAEYAGNAMMDCLETSGGEDLRWGLIRRYSYTLEAPIVALLPGSRQEAYLNLEDLTVVARRLQEHDHWPVAFPVALAPGLDQDEAARVIRAAGGSVAAIANPGERHRSITTGYNWPHEGEEGCPNLALIPGRFGDVVAASDVVVGLAGTANEQAAGLGKPVVTFPGRGPQFTARFAAAQKRLLGEAVALVTGGPEAVAATVRRLLSDPAERQRRGAVGQERMGGPGATGRMAEAILATWEGLARV